MSVAPIKKKRSTLVIVLVILGVIFVLCLIIGLISSSSPSGKATSTARSMTQTSAALPTVTPVPTQTQKYDPGTMLEQGITKALGEGNRNVPRLVSVTKDIPNVGDIYVNWSANEYYTDQMINIGIETDAVTLLKYIDESGTPFERVILDGYYPLVDPYGNSSETMVVHLIYNKATVDKINWANFLNENIYNIADEVWLAPAVKQ